MTEAIEMQGYFEIEVKENGKTKEKVKIKNLIMNNALDEVLKSLQDFTVDIGIKYLALGTSNTANTNALTQLGNEIFRTQFVDQDKVDIGELRTIFTVLDSEAVAQIEEIGIFCGSSATSSANSGLMLSRILWSRNKTNTEEIQFTRVDKVVR